LLNLKRWRDAIRERGACARGVNIPVKVENLEKNPEAAKKFAENARKMVQTCPARIRQGWREGHCIKTGISRDVRQPGE